MDGDTTDLIQLLSQADMHNELWLKAKYDQLAEKQTPGFCLVSIALKNFMEYRHQVGHEFSQPIIEACYHQLRGCLDDDETIVRIHSWCYNLLIKCPAEEECLHKRASAFHYAVRDAMRQQFGQPLFLEMGFYPIILPAVDFYCAQYYADLCRFREHSHFPESNYDMYYVSFQDQKEDFRKLEKRTAAALKNGDFRLYLQPKVDTVTGEVHSAEALMRWIDPVDGMIPLSSFLPNIDENGFIREVDLYLFDKACSYLEKWCQINPVPFQISFNLSKAYFNGVYFLPEYKEVFQKYQLPADCICIELLESIVLNDYEKLKSITNGIHSLGFQCALDDFGSGFSSFDILTNIALSELKIDRSLFQDLHNPKERQLIKLVVEFCHTFGMKTVAEGIETKEYAEYLKEIGCDYIQGFYYYKPMPIEEFEKRFITKEQENGG